MWGAAAKSHATYRRGFTQLYAVLATALVLAIHREHFEEAFRKVKPSVSVDDQLVYDSLRKKL